MPEVSSDPTIAMIGGGYYSANALGAKEVIDATKPLVDEALVHYVRPFRKTLYHWRFRCG